MNVEKIQLAQAPRSFVTRKINYLPTFTKNINGSRVYFFSKKIHGMDVKLALSDLENFPVEKSWRNTFLNIYSLLKKAKDKGLKSVSVPIFADSNRKASSADLIFNAANKFAKDGDKIDLTIVIPRRLENKFDEFKEIINSKLKVCS